MSFHPSDVWRRIKSLGMMTPLERASSDLAETERSLYEANRAAEEHAALCAMLEKRKKTLRTLVDSLNQEQKDPS